MKKLLPIALFLVAIGVVATGVALQAWATEAQNDIERQAEAFAAERATIESDLEDLAKRLESPVTEFDTVKTRVPGEVKCTVKGFVPRCKPTFRTVETKVPRVVGTEINSEIAAQIDAGKKRIDQIDQTNEELADRSRYLEQLANVDKESFRGLLSLLVLISALIVILSRAYNAESQKWAYGAVGTILGYWFGV